MQEKLAYIWDAIGKPIIIIRYLDNKKIMRDKNAR